MRMMRVILAGLLLIGGCVTFVYRQGVSPRLTLYEIGRAIDSHDYAAFERYADVGALAQQLDAEMPRTLPQLEARHVMVHIPQGAFTPQFQEQMRRYVETGKAAPRVSDLLDMLRGNGAETAITDIIEQADGSQLVTLRHEFKRAEVTTDVRLVMQKRGPLWMVTKIENLPAIMAALDQFEIARLRVENRDKKVVLGDALSVTDGRVTAVDPRPSFSFTAQNHGADTIERARLRIMVKVDNENVGYGDFWMTLHLAPGQQRAFNAPPEALQSYSRREPFERWSVTFEPLGIATSSGRVVELYSGPSGIPE